ncbi:Autophagy-related 8b [Carabus blaptoides fortunei]
MEMRKNIVERRKKDINSNVNGVRHKKTVEIRKEEVLAIRNRFPTKIPIIVQRFSKETNLPHLDKSKFLVPQEITMSQFVTIIRNRMRISSTQTLYLLVNNRSMLSLSVTLAEAYSEFAGPDGFLYVTYASQEVFGAQHQYFTQT